MKIDLSVQHVTKTYADFTAVDDVSFQVETGRFFSILGPSGCGKTTLLRMIAGLSEPDSGKIEIRARDMAGIPPNRRPVNLIFQNLALFPMMDVAENIAFGLHRRGEGKAVIHKKVSAILERVDLAGFETKKIEQLSGGQKQRVAIARCLVLEPAVLLLDEPLGALDLKLREQMKVELKKLQAKVGTTFVYITHDQSEALVMSDHVAVMNQGVFQQMDTPQNLYNHPRTPFVARFVGDNNAWAGRVNSSDGKTVSIETNDGFTFQVLSDQSFQPGEPVDLFLRPEAMLIQPDEAIADLNRFEVVVKSLLFDGANSRLLVNPLKTGTELLIALPQNRQYDYVRRDDKIEVGWAKTSGLCFPKIET
ncbi:Spermidine/putrescine import ABC transporter ATP-binding protein PotA (TC 3.A.1.11.1) [Olavius algarvensis associated proteobacterium Delta 3]|nr:Spermidine/putrescine import ABC transporter ATP-binding protein PotA (TC 3.A.1.11.1) [Olavius algarvensis associated proteobacterium Delta 3]CAB5168372.1 Spermidine/putrescine import ABC transporter ATP-binding protein PotA (TC 3.A.1.11.1) [Olavius algarvensis associated proteobacterium Delta 3]